MTIALALALVPLLKDLRLPLSFDWGRLLSAYWLVVAAQSIFAATLLVLLALPCSNTLVPWAARIRRNPLRIVFLLVFFLILTWATSWVKALIISVDAAAILELRERKGAPGLRKTSAALLAPALYLFAGFLLIFAYNDIILSVRYFAAYDQAFQAADRWLLRGLTVPAMTAWAVRIFPLSFFHFLEFIYFGMFAQIGAAMILTCAIRRRGESLRFVGTILTAYYLALLLFFLWPSQGPYYLQPSHLPATLQASAFQRFSIANSQALWNHLDIRRISTDYYIAFPCMHITQPLVVLWFLRRWKRMIAALAIYDTFLVFAIILLEWHYVVDILAGIVVAAIAILVVDRPSWQTRNQLATVPA